MKSVSHSQIVLTLSVSVLALALTAASASAQFYFGIPVNLGPSVNSSDGEGGPVLSADGRTMYFLSNRPGGSGDWDGYVATRESENDEWGPAVNLGPRVNSASTDGPWSVSADGLWLYFASNRPGGYGGNDLWVTTRATTSAPWGSPVNLAAINTSYGDADPSISADGLSLYFRSPRPGGYGGQDLWVTTRTSLTAPWRSPVNLGSTVNSSSDEYHPSISADGLLLFFASTRPGGFGPDDIYVTTRARVSDPWETPVNLGPQINTPAEDFGPSISADGSTFYFTSSGHGGHGYYDMWQVPILSGPICGDSEHPYPIGDLNKDCRVDIEDLLLLIEHWMECTAPECE